MRGLDQKAVASGMSLETLMLEAGKRVAEQAETLGKHVLIVVGKGNNGGDGLAAAFFLKKKGIDVTVVLVFPEEHLKDEPRLYLEKLKSARGRIFLFEEIEMEFFELAGKADLIVDGLLGFSLKGAPREPVAGVIELINKAGKPVLAIDAPSGLDVSTGKVFQPCVKATQTLTLSLPKKGFKKKKARDFTGKIFLADIGIPNHVYQQFGLTREGLFGKEKIVPVKS